MRKPDFRDSELPVEDRVAALLGELSVEEKLSLCAGRDFWRTKSVPRLGIRPFRMTDGPRGVAFHSARKRGTSFPSGIALGASWDPALAYRLGEALGEEARAAGCGVVLGPAVNLCRTPLGGRTFEYLTEDPHLNVRLAVPYIRGVQSRGVAACVKHYAANNQETDRMRVDVRVSQRALRELYLPVFEASVREANVGSVMAAYNGVNGTPACENRELLSDILRDEWGFGGFVVSDWFAARRTTSAEACLRAGLSLEMPGRGTRYATRNLRREFQSGGFDESDLDRVLSGLLAVMFRTGHIDQPITRRPGPISTPVNQQLAQEVAEAGITLLQNRGALLPLDFSRVRKLAVVGPKAKARNCLPLWGGSSGVWPPHEVTPARGIEEAIAGRCEIVSDPAEADVAIVCVGLSHRPGQDSEVRDRRNLALPLRQVALIRQTLAANPNTVVVLIAGGPIAGSWVEAVPALLMAWYPGMEGGRAIGRVLTGECNPSGKLPVSFPARFADSPAHASADRFPGDGREVHYTEDVFVGYRHFDRARIEPLFGFGHGLSYTAFTLEGLELESHSWEGEGTLGVSFILRNVGIRDGAEVVQLYLGDAESSADRPPRELVAFEKRFLPAGESARLEMRITARDLAWFDEQHVGWRAEAGTFTVHVGVSSRDLRLESRFELVKDWFEPLP